ncbi:hypothetical protein Pla22_12140 [Rubripirellula amarantea]|uniref:Uncharacterized protein n=1 Tax=Rubripirellula amarantea TaxID=2527999 RepID=A0A5C5WUA2_9BACT|nr:hypothetical protein [Rubripirellula amarantea]TWT53585.1 hypothetical protein Pla22_12140 [Rubripirellula amarantea]
MWKLSAARRLGWHPLDRWHPLNKRALFDKIALLDKSALLLVILFVSPAGCNRSSAPPLHYVRGIVRFPDGVVLRDGTVEFESLEYQKFGLENPVTARGKIQPDGSFLLGTYAADDGALAGEHRVVVIAYHDIGNGAERPGMIPTATLDRRYSSYRTSPLRQTVQPNDNGIIIEVEYASSRVDVSDTSGRKD